MDKVEIRGNWNEIKDRLQEQYETLTDDDLEYVKGEEQALVTRLQRALGKSRREVVEIINSASTMSETASRDNIDDDMI
jgi:uncharacterized protein YjbJ (UPF0337 family)